MTRWLIIAAVAVALVAPASADAACCYFSAKNTDILQPAQKVFLSWDPVEKIETFTVQPNFEGNALDFGMVIPTPSQPKLHEMPRDFFKHLAIFSILKQGQSRFNFGAKKGGGGVVPVSKPPTKVKILEEGLVGSLDYK